MVLFYRMFSTSSPDLKILVSKYYIALILLYYTTVITFDNPSFKYAKLCFFRISCPPDGVQIKLNESKLNCSYPPGRVDQEQFFDNLSGRSPLSSSSNLKNPSFRVTILNSVPRCPYALCDKVPPQTMFFAATSSQFCAR